MIAIIIGACFLILVGVIDLRIPGSYIVSFVIFITIFGGHGLDYSFISAHLAGGGLMLGAFFMATDYVTRPVTVKGQYVFGMLLGILTGIFRIFGASAEGVSYAISPRPPKSILTTRMAKIPPITPIHHGAEEGRFNANKRPVTTAE